jgi:hypothetical protein
MIARIPRGKKMLAIYKVDFHYFCLPGNHENRVTRYYRAFDSEDLKKRFSLHYPCSECSPDAVPEGKLSIDFEAEEISETEFELSGGTLEPEIM